MSHLPSIISDLAVILISAGLVSLLFKRLKQPVVLGYIVAGILAGPSIASIPTVSETDSIRIWADIGVVFLLFALGLDFSFKKLMKVGGTAVVGAVTVVFGMMSVGYTTGLSLGWGHMNSLFLGGMLSMSSTTIIFKAFEDMELRNKRFAGVVFGILVVEDLFAVLLMVWRTNWTLHILYSNPTNNTVFSVSFFSVSEYSFQLVFPLITTKSPSFSK